MKKRGIPILFYILAALACGGSPAPVALVTERTNAIPETAIKQVPAGDAWPPRAAPGWTHPVPLPAPVNTAGGEDSPFLTADGKHLYFFFTPDVNIPAEKQLLDGATGIWVADRSGDAWKEPVRVLLARPGELALDGCPFILEDLMLFCSARQGVTGIQWFQASYQDGTWQDWQPANELGMEGYEVGELHISADGQQLVFHSARPGGYGSLDLWISTRTALGWSDPVNLGAGVNTSMDESRPYLSPDGKELWFTGSGRGEDPGPAILRSLLQENGTWGPSEVIITSFAGEPTLSPDGGTLYFVHHFFSPDLSTMLEADIYVSYRLP